MQVQVRSPLYPPTMNDPTPTVDWKGAVRRSPRQEGVTPMSWQTDTISPRAVHSSWRWRRTGVALLMGLALIVAACGTTTGRGSQPTPTPNPSPTATPAPCTGWRIVASPTNTKYPNSSLSAVSAISPTDVWVVGTQSNPGRPLIMHWNGTAWSVVPGVYPTGVFSAWLSSVAAIASNDVWAFGGQWTTPPDQQAPDVLVEHWDGASWQIVSNPALPPKRAPQGGGALSVTRIPGTNQLWAAGEWHEWIGLGPGEPLIERWDGTTWQIVPSPALPKGAIGGGWSRVVALSASNAWAVGRYSLRNVTDFHPLIAHWDGTRWQNVLADSNTYGSLDSVAAGGANDVRAAGTLVTGPGASSGNGQAVPLIEQWNGTNWQIATTPDLPSGALFQGLHIATDGAGNYWAVGSYLNATGNGQYQTAPLVLHCP
jgi:hypothetical protein